MIQLVKTLRDRWNATADRIVATALSAATPDETLSILGTAIRKYRTAKNRMEVVAKRLTDVAIRTMENYNQEELRVSRRTFIRLNRTFAIPSTDKGQAAYDRLVESFGQSFVDRLYTTTEEMVPATTVTSFSLDEAVLESLDTAVAREVARTLDLTIKLDVVDVPKRVKEGKPRGKRKRK